LVHTTFKPLRRGASQLPGVSLTGEAFEQPIHQRAALHHVVVAAADQAPPFPISATVDVRVGPDDRFKPPARSRAVVEEMFDCGAIITGRRTFDIAGGWGGHHPVGAPFFLLTHNPPGEWVGPGTDGTVVTDGIESALEQARAVAGDRAIAVGGADVAQQYLKAGLLDELHLNLVPVLSLGVLKRGTSELSSPEADPASTSIIVLRARWTA